MMKQSIALLGAVLLVLVVATGAQKPAAGAGAAKTPPQAPGHQRARNENANGGTCDVDTFAESALYNFVDACWDMPAGEDEGDDFDGTRTAGCSERCHEAFRVIVSNSINPCISMLSNRPAQFMNKGKFKGTGLKRTTKHGLGDFSMTLKTSDNIDAPVDREFLSTLFMDTIIHCPSPFTAVSNERCGNDDLEVFTASVWSGFEASCSAQNALVTTPDELCKPSCAAGYFHARQHPCFVRFVSELDANAPWTPASATRLEMLKTASRLCSAPAAESYLNVSLCSNDDMEVYMALSVIPFRRQCTANISSSIPTERSCTKRCDSTLQRVLSQPSCLARWSSAEAKRSESKGSVSDAMLLLTRAIQTCTVAREQSYVLGNIHLYDDPDAFSAGPTVRSHVSNSPAMRAMFGVVGGFLLLVGGVVAWGNRHYCCPRKHRYQRVSTNNRV